MLRFSSWTIGSIVAICIAGVVFSLPNLFPRAQMDRMPDWLPHQQINLGLDLQGGSHLLLEVGEAFDDAGAAERIGEGVAVVVGEVQGDRRRVGVVWWADEQLPSARKVMDDADALTILREELVPDPETGKRGLLDPRHD